MGPFELLGYGIPRQVEPGPEGDRAKVRNARGAVARLNVCDREFSRTHASEEILHMVRAVIEPLSILRQRGIDDGLVARAKIASVDPNPPLCPFKANAVALTRRILNAAENVIGPGGFNVVNDSIGISELHLVFTNGSVTAGNWLCQSLGLDGRRARQANGPQRDVIVMCAPIGHRASRVVVPITEIQMTSLRQVIDFRRLAEPEIPVQFLRHRL